MHIQEKSKLNLAKISNSSPTLEKLIKQLSYKVGVTYDHALHEILAMSTPVVSGQVKMEIWGREHLCNEYFILIAESSERKTGTQSELISKFLKEHGKLRRKYREELEEWEREVKKYEDSIKRTGIAGIKPPKPIDPNIMLGSDCTKEALFMEFGACNVNIKLLRSDDAGDFFESIGMQDSARFRMMVVLNKLWSNSEVTETKVKHGGTMAIEEEEALLNINFAMQSSMFYKHLCNDMNKTIGFTARFLITRAEKLSGERNKLFGARGYAEGQKYYNREAEKMRRSENQVELEEFKRDLTAQLLEVTKSAKKNGGKAKLKARWLDEGALKLYAEISASLEDKQGAGQRYEDYSELVGKAGQHLIHLIAIVDWIESRGKRLEEEISSNVVWTAWQLLEYYIEQHLAIIHPEDRMERDMGKGTRKFVNWLKKNSDRKYISWQKLLRSCSALKTVGKELRDEIIKEAVEMKYIEDHRSTPHKVIVPVEIEVRENGKILTKLYKSYIKILPEPIIMKDFGDLRLDPADPEYWTGTSAPSGVTVKDKAVDNKPRFDCEPIHIDGSNLKEGA